MILEKLSNLSNKVKPKKNMYRSNSRVKIDISPDKTGNIGVGEEGMVKGEEKVSRGRGEEYLIYFVFRKIIYYIM